MNITIIIAVITLPASAIILLKATQALNIITRKLDTPIYCFQGPLAFGNPDLLGKPSGLEEPPSPRAQHTWCLKSGSL